MRPSEVTLNFGTPQDSPRTSSDFEEVPYPHHWSSSQGQPEELPLHYMSEETTRRRLHQHPDHQHPPYGSAGYDDYPVGPAEQDDGGKDVYAKMRQSHGGLGGGRPRRLPPPPPTSVVRLSAFVIAFLFHSLSTHILTYPAASASLFRKTSNTSPPFSTPFSRVGLVSIVSESQTSSSGMKRTLESLARITSNASSTLMSIRRWGRCLLGSRDCCLGIMVVSSSRAGRRTLTMYPTSPCGS